MERFQDKRVWLGGGAVVALLIVAIGWFMFISPELSSTNALRGQAAATREQDTLLQLKLNALAAKRAEIGKYKASLKQALDSLPVDSGMPAFTRQLTAQAATSGVTLLGVAAGGVSPVVSAVPATTTTDSASPSASPDPTSSAGAIPAAPSIAGSLYQIQVTIESDGTLAHQLAFLNAIRTAGARRALVTSTQVSPTGKAVEDSIDKQSSFTTQLTIFSAPQTPAQVAQLNTLLSGKIGN